MGRTFNTDGCCERELNYMVDLSGRLAEIKTMVDGEKYFTINRARQYGKTTLLNALADELKEEYEEDYHTGMEIGEISRLIFDYTSGYPFLVSRLCKVMDEKLRDNGAFSNQSSVWTRRGFFEAEKIVAKENSTLYQSLIEKLGSYPQLRTVLYELLFTGKPIPYTATNDYIQVAEMFGFIRNEKETAVISNRIFETVLYNFFISEEFAVSKIYSAGVQEKNQFIVGGHLDVRRILEKFVETFDYLYGEQDEAFQEEAGRRYFLLFL